MTEGFIRSFDERTSFLRWVGQELYCKDRRVEYMRIHAHFNPHAARKYAIIYSVYPGHKITGVGEVWGTVEFGTRGELMDALVRMLPKPPLVEVEAAEEERRIYLDSQWNTEDAEMRAFEAPLAGADTDQPEWTQILTPGSRARYAAARAGEHNAVRIFVHTTSVPRLFEELIPRFEAQPPPPPPPPPASPPPREPWLLPPGVEPEKRRARLGKYAPMARRRI